MKSEGNYFKLRDGVYIAGSYLFIFFPSVLKTSCKQVLIYNVLLRYKDETLARVSFIKLLVFLFNTNILRMHYENLHMPYILHMNSDKRKQMTVITKHYYHS